MIVASIRVPSRQLSVRTTENHESVSQENVSQSRFETGNSRIQVIGVTSKADYLRGIDSRVPLCFLAVSNTNFRS